MSKVVKLQESLAKAEAKAEKCKGTIERHEKQLVKKVDAFIKRKGIQLDINNQEQIDSLKWAKDREEDDYWHLCEIESKKEDIRGAGKKLAEAEKIVSNWKEKLEKEIDKDDFISKQVPQVVKDFLEQWKQMAYDWHIQRYNDYQSFKVKVDADEFKNWKEKRELKATFAGTAVLYMDTIYNEAERLAWLEQTLETDKRHKMIDLITRVNGYVGEITDATGLYVSDAGNLNGFITGEKGTVKLETIGAGGYNIVCFHYRTLINYVK